MARGFPSAVRDIRGPNKTFCGSVTRLLKLTLKALFEMHFSWFIPV